MIIDYNIVLKILKVKIYGPFYPPILLIFKPPSLNLSLLFYRVQRITQNIYPVQCLPYEILLDLFHRGEAYLTGGLG